jgi:hypothetical protein
MKLYIAASFDLLFVHMHSTYYLHFISCKILSIVFRSGFSKHKRCASNLTLHNVFFVPNIKIKKRSDARTHSLGGKKYSKTIEVRILE